MTTPLVVACLRHVDQRPDVDPLTGAVRRTPRSATASAADLASLEYALRVADAWSGRVLAVSAGPPAADETLRLAASLGAEVVRVSWPDGAGAYLHDVAGDERSLAEALTAAILTVDMPALVLCGDRSTDRGTGALPAFLAHELGAAQALGLVRLAVDGDQLRGERRIEGGRREALGIPRPAVCSVEGGLRPRRASLAATMRAVSAEVPVHAHTQGTDTRVRLGVARPLRPRTQVAQPPAGDSAHARVLQLTGALTTHEPPTVVGPTDAATAVDAFLGFLDRAGYLAEDAR